MSTNMYCVSLINAAGKLQAGFSSDGLRNWSHYEEPGESQVPGFVEITGLLTSNTPAVTTKDDILCMAFLGHSDQKLYFGTSGDGTTWSSRVLAGQQASSPPFIAAVVSAQTLWMAYPGLMSHEIYVSKSDDDGQTWSTKPIGQTSSDAPSILYVWPFIGSETPEHVEFIMVFRSHDSSNDLLLCTSIDNGSSWQRGPNVGQQSSSAPSLSYAPGNSYGGNFSLAFLATDGTNEILVCNSVGGLSWSGAVRTGHHSRGAPALTFYNDLLHLYYLGLTNNNIYVVRSPDGVNWTGFTGHQVCSGGAAPALTSFSFLPTPLLTQPKPPADVSLGDNSNYFLYSNCVHLRGVSVTIEVKKDIVVKSSSNLPLGCGFQLNGYAPTGYPNSAWQQYAIIFIVNTSLAPGSPPAALYYQIDNWPLTTVSAKPTTTEDLFNSGRVLLYPLTEAKIPAGHKLKIFLGNDWSDKVNSVTFEVENNGVTLKTKSIQLTSVPLSSPTPTQTTANDGDFAPIVAFELDLVGVVNGYSSTLSSGKGPS